jgi:hypothetical protein
MVIVKFYMPLAILMHMLPGPLRNYTLKLLLTTPLAAYQKTRL